MKKLFASVTIITATFINAQNTDLKDLVTTEVTNHTKEATKEAAKGLANALGEATWGIRANGLINTSSLGNLADIKDLKESGFNIGVSAKVELGSNFFVNPELYYTHSGNSQIDLPILFGYEILPEKISLIAGPSLMYAFSKNSKDDLTKIATEALASGGINYNGLSSMFKFGYQAGVQVHFGNFMIAAKYEGALSGQVVSLINKATDQSFEEKVKSNFVSLGIGYNFGKN